MTTIQRLVFVLLYNMAAIGAPGNDDFANSTFVSNNYFQTNQTIAGATMEVGEPSSGAGQVTIWFTFVPPETRGYLAWAVHSQAFWPNPAVFAYQGGAVTNLTALTNNFTGDSTRQFYFAVRATAGEPIHFQVVNRSGAASIDFGVAAAPENDDFENAHLITNSVLFGSTLAATAEGEEVGHNTVWYRWQPAEETGYRIELRSLAPPHAFAFYEGDTLTDLHLITRLHIPFYSSGEVITNLFVTDSKTYYIGVSGLSVYSGQFRLVILKAQENDTFSRRQTILTDETVQAYTGTASRQPGEPLHNGTNHLHTLWYEWSAPRKGGFYVESEVGDPTPSFSVYQGTDLKDLTAIPVRQVLLGSFPEDQTVHAFHAEAGEKYLIVLHEQLSRTIRFQLQRGIEHDEFENALEVTLDSDQEYSGAIATVQPGEEGLGHSGATLWHRFVAPTNGSYVALGSSGQVRVYRGSSLSTLAIAERTSAEILLPAFPFRASAGENFHIAVNEPGGVYSLGIAGAAPNDDFQNRLPAESSGSVLTNVWATLEPGEQAHGTNSLGGSLWWKWKPEGAGAKRVLALAAGHFVNLSVYRGEKLDSLELAAQAESLYGGSIAVDVVAEPQVEYSIRLSYLPLSAAPVILEFHTPPDHDDFSNALSLQLGERVTREVGIVTREPFETFFPDKGTLWYRWTAAESGSYVFAASPLFSGVAVFSGGDVATLQEIASLARPYANAGLAFRAQAGTTYHIALAPDIGFLPTVVSAEILRGPENDDLAGRAKLSGEYVHWVGTTFGATLETAEAVPDESYYATVWAEWTAPSSGLYRILGGTRHISLLLEVFRDEQNIGERMLQGGPGVDFPAVAGETYSIRVASTPREMQAFDLRLGPRPENVTPTAATSLTGTNMTVATPFWTVPNLHWREGRTNLWYQWTAPSYGMLVYAANTNVPQARVGIFHTRRPTISSNIVVRPAELIQSPTGGFAVTKGVTYLFGLFSEPSTNLTLQLVFEEPVELEEFSNAFVGGSVVPIVQGETFYSAPKALQMGPVEAGKIAFLEMVFPRGMLRYRLKGEGPTFELSISNGISRVSPSFGRAFSWRESVLDLRSMTNVVRWTLKNQAAGASQHVTVWFDDFEFVPAPPLAPNLSVDWHWQYQETLELRFLVESNRVVALDVSTNLVTWSPWTNIYSPENARRGVPLRNSSEEKQRFFRAHVLD